MTSELYTLFLACFPGIVREKSKVETILSYPENRILERRAEGKLIGAAVLNRNTILMLCVHPAYRGQGIGSGLLTEAETEIREAGYDTVQFCDGVEYITPGIPLYEGNQAFFEKRGYAHSWGDCECVDMRMELRDFSATENSIGDTIRGIRYRWAEPADIPEITACVEDAWQEFTVYYQDAALYDPRNSQRVLLALDGETVCGTLIVSNGTEQARIGSVGCTATKKAYQGRGIATTMVKLGTKYLRDAGLPTAFLGYTYTDIIPMYSRSGYTVCMKYMMAKKTM